MHRNMVIALAIGLAIAISWPIAVYFVYPVPPESIEQLINISGDSFVSEKIPRFLIGVRWLVAFRGTGFRTRGIPVLIHRHTTFFKTETDEIIIVVFMPRYKCIGREYELSGNDIAKLITGDTVLKGYIFLTQRGVVLIPIEIVVGNNTFIAVPPYR